MNFTHSHFLFTFPLFIIPFWCLRGWPQKLWLLLASYTFYAYFSLPYALLLVASTFVDYALGLWMVSRPNRKKTWAVLSILFNLGLLASFKYASFLFNDILLPLNQALGLGQLEAIGKGLPPMGISFFTFQTLSYSLDIYRGQLKPTRNLLDFSVYVSMFPQLVAGPIVRAKDLLHQITGRCRFVLEDVREGLKRFAIGLMKKICLADALAITMVDPVFNHLGDHGPEARTIAVFAYSLQIYFDFSGYSDMAIGLGRMMGFTFPENFRHPYQATSFSDFWKRWHISLSSWLRDYLYIPLGGNRQGPTRTQMNLMLTMVLGGLWHGASWRFVLWGFLHGLFLVLQRTGGKLLPGGLHVTVAIPLVFLFVSLAWIPFRAESFNDILPIALAPLQCSIEGWSSWFMNHGNAMILLLLSALAHWHPLLKKACRWEQWPLEIKTVFFSSFLFWAISLKPSGASPFIYFQF
jgi:alginate O-acetyltransferase complex protein AlgI